jgi:uncharacterized protein (DUF983 family)
MGGMTTTPSSPLPSVAKMFRRALTRRCPHCGARRTFIRRWLWRFDRCRSCGIRWHREHGFELGPIALNVVITFFTLGVSMAVAFALTAPDIPVVGFMIGFISAAVLVPMVAHPFTFTLWLAFDLAVRKPDQAELADAARAVAEGDVHAD